MDSMPFTRAKVARILTLQVCISLVAIWGKYLEETESYADSSAADVAAMLQHVQRADDAHSDMVASRVNHSASRPRNVRCNEEGVQLWFGDSACCSDGCGGPKDVNRNCQRDCSDCCPTLPPTPRPTASPTLSPTSAPTSKYIDDDDITVELEDDIEADCPHEFEFGQYKNRVYFLDCAGAHIVVPSSSCSMCGCFYESNGETPNKRAKYRALTRGHMLELHKARRPFACEMVMGTNLLQQLFGNIDGDE